MTLLNYLMPILPDTFVWICMPFFPWNETILHTLFITYLKKSFFFLMFIYFWDTERECKQGRDREGGRQRIWSRLQVLSYQHRARHGARAHQLRDHDLSQSWTPNRPSHPGAPTTLLSLKGQRQSLCVLIVTEAPGSSVVCGIEWALTSSSLRFFH